MIAEPTTADTEFETSLIEAVAAARARYAADDRHLIHPLEGLADWYAARGDFVRSKPPLKQAISIRLRTWGPKHPELALALSLLAKIVASEGKFQKADEYFKQATKCLLEASPPRDLELADTWNQWAELLFARGEVDRALRMCCKARVALGGSEPRYPALMLRVQNNLGALKLLSGRSRAALREFIRNFRLARKIYVPDNPALITVYNNLAEALLRINEISRAEWLLRRSLKIARSSWGWNHPLTASTGQHLAGAWSLAGRWTSAAKLYDRVYRAARKRSSVTQNDVLKAALNAAELRCALQAWVPAEKLLDRLLSDVEQLETPSPAIRALLRSRLARIYLVTGRLATAERWLNEAWQIFQPQATEHPLLVAELAFSLGMDCTQRSKFEDAADFFQQALTLQEQSQSKRHPDVAKTLIEQGRCELRRGNADAAIARFQRALSLRKSTLGRMHPLTAAAVLDLAEARCLQRAWTTAQELGRCALSMLEQNSEEIPHLLAAACGLLSRAACELDQHQQAEEFALRELTIRQRLAGTEHADLAPVYLRLGRLQRMSDRIAEAVAALQRGLAITERTRGTADAAVIPFLEELCSLRATDGPTSDLGLLVERYLKCQQRVYGHQSEELGLAQDQAAEWWRAAGDETRASELNGRAVSLRELSMHVFGDLM